MHSPSTELLVEANISAFLLLMPASAAVPLPWPILRRVLLGSDYGMVPGSRARKYRLAPRKWSTRLVHFPNFTMKFGGGRWHTPQQVDGRSLTERNDRARPSSTSRVSYSDKHFTPLWVRSATYFCQFLLMRLLCYFGFAKNCSRWGSLLIVSLEHEVTRGLRRIAISACGVFTVSWQKRTL